MKKLILIFFVSLIFGCSGTEDPSSNPPDEIQIENQIWMKENLDLKTFRNGDPLFESKTTEQWIQLYLEKKPAYTVYLWKEGNEDVFGIIYNYYALIDPRGLAPENWRIPTSTDYFDLVENNGGSNVASPKLMSQNLWLIGKNGSNESGFNAKPGGQIWAGGTFTDINESIVFWTNSRSQQGDLIVFGIFSSLEETGAFFSEISIKETLDRKGGFYIRCIKE
jgi:uncharacterized protein (TIGR02145 family)